MSKKLVQRIDLKHKIGQSRGANTSEEIWIQFFGDANKSLATGMILYRSRDKKDDGQTVFSAVLSYEGKHIIRQQPNISSSMLVDEWIRLIAGFEEQGFTVGKSKKSSEHKGGGSVENIKTVTLTRDDPIEMELELPESFVRWANTLANDTAENE